VVPPRRIAILARVRGDDDVRVAVKQVVESHVTLLAALPTLGREEQGVHRTDPAEASAGEPHERAVDTPKNAKGRADACGGHLSSARRRTFRGRKSPGIRTSRDLRARNVCLRALEKCPPHATARPSDRKSTPLNSS